MDEAYLSEHALGWEALRDRASEYTPERVAEITRLPAETLHRLARLYDGAIARAENLGVPMISLSTSAEQRPTGRFIFHIRHSPEHRARTLAQRALAKGIKTFAIMAPDTPYGG